MQVGLFDFKPSNQSVACLIGSGKLKKLGEVICFQACQQSTRTPPCLAISCSNEAGSGVLVIKCRIYCTHRDMLSCTRNRRPASHKPATDGLSPRCAAATAIFFLSR